MKAKTKSTRKSKSTRKRHVYVSGAYVSIRAVPRMAREMLGSVYAGRRGSLDGLVSAIKSSDRSFAAAVWNILDKDKSPTHAFIRADLWAVLCCALWRVRVWDILGKNKGGKLRLALRQLGRSGAMC